MNQQEQKPSIQKRKGTWLSHLTPEIGILLIVLAVSAFMVIIFQFYPPQIFFGFMTSWIAGILGILTGFAMDRIIEQGKDDRVKKDFLALMRNELTEIKGKIPPQTKTPLMLYPEVWDSFVSSGLMRMLTAEQVTKLSNVYRIVKGTQYEAERVRQIVEELSRIPDAEKDEKQFLKERYTFLRENYLRNGARLSELIDEILKEEWWK